MIFENSNNPAVEGGGLIIKIIDKEENPIPTGAVFEIVDEDGNVVDTITTDNAGSFMTGNKDLPLNRKYTARLKNGPPGYIATVFELDETLTENEKYKTLVFKFITKKCTVSIKSTKKYNQPLQGGDFTFELFNVNNKTSVKAKNNKNGNITFTMNYDGSDLGYTIYELTEINDNKANISYDDHKEEITVLVEDDGGDDLACSVVYKNNTPVFTNTYNGIKPTPPTPEISPNTSDKIIVYMILLVISLSFILRANISHKINSL